MSRWGIKASMPRGKTHGQICPVRRFYYAHTFLRCFLVVVTCSASMLWQCQTSNINYLFDVTKRQAGVDCATKCLLSNTATFPSGDLVRRILLGSGVLTSIIIITTKRCCRFGRETGTKQGFQLLQNTRGHYVP